MNSAPISPAGNSSESVPPGMSETLIWCPITAKLPDLGTNVLLAMSDGTTCEGFLMVEPGHGFQWYDACAEPIDHDTVTHWADMPDGPHV